MDRLRYTTLLSLIAILLFSCTDDLGLSSPELPGEYLRFTATLGSDSIVATTRSTSAHLVTEEEVWLVDSERMGTTRGTMTKEMKGDVGVSAYTSSTQYFTNDQYSFDGDELKTTEPTRWSTIKGTNTQLTFFAYAPYMTDAQLTAMQSGYTVPQVPKKQIDIISDVVTVNSGDFGKTVAFNFEHVLTAIRFKVGFDCKVNSITVSNVYNQGKFDLSTNKMTQTGTSTDNYPITINKSFTAGSVVSPDDEILMMIPQKLPANATVKLNYDDNQELTATIGGKTWEAGKFVTYTLYKETPNYIYFDLAAGNVLIGCTEDASDKPTATNTYSGFVFEDGKTVSKTGEHSESNIYYVYQTKENNTGTSSLPNYSPITHNGKPWADFIRNNASVAGVILAWNEAAAKANRKATSNRIRVYGSNKVVNLTIDNIYSTYADRSVARTKAGIGFNAGSNSKLTITTVGDNRVSAIHYYGGKDKNNELIFEGTGSLTVAAASGSTEFYNTNYVGETEANDTTFIDNHWCSAIGGNDSGEGNSCGIIINSGNIYAGTTKAEQCTAIGAGGNDRGIITINGGNVTAVATTTGTAIGGGIGFNSAGGVGSVTINGGNVYAYNHQNRWNIPSSAIGGAGSSASSGTIGYITINGGYVYAYSALGTAIGGGSSKTNVGGDAQVTITGGHVIAKSGNGAGIGGGSACTGKANTSENIYNGGTANVTISGNPIIRTGSIGGGSSDDPKGGKKGSAVINVSGGDIQAQFVMEAGTKATPTFTMSGGTIRNSYVDDPEYIHTSTLGGAVYLGEGKFTMSGGTIKNCSAEQGGAVYIGSSTGNSSFMMTGGEIQSCFATGKYDTNKNLVQLGHGGAVCLNGGDVDMLGGKIWNNYSENGHGGAIYINNGNFTMRDGDAKEGMPEIYENVAQKGDGGGVYVTSSNSNNQVRVDLLQGIITNNAANNYGGGVCVDMKETDNSANVTVGVDGQGVTEADADPKISENISLISGGGLYVRGSEANVTINSGMIDKNEVSAYVSNEDVTNEEGMVLLNDGLVDHIVVTFHGNEGTFDGTTTYTQKIVTKTNSKLAPNKFIRSGYNFKCWNTRPDGLGIDYSNEALMNVAEDISLYAQWTAQ